MKKRKPKESEIEKEILRYLHIKGIEAWKNKSMGTFDPSTKRFRFNPNMKLGVSDILGILSDGRFLAIEVKRDKTCKPSDHQRKFIQMINDKGGLAFVARSVEDVIDSGL